MAIPLVDVAWQHRQVRTAIDSAYEKILTDTVCDGVEFCNQLEADFTAYFGANTYAIAVQSGLAAEFLILKALGIGPGDEVITAPNSDMATTAAISHAGARFVLVDIDALTHNLDPAKIVAAITPNTRAIMPVHMYGLPAEMEPINAIAQAYNLHVIEDATLALGAQYKGRKAGTLGSAAFFSFAPRKVLGGIGNGGLILTRDGDLAQRVRLLKGYGLSPELGERPIGERHLYGDQDHLTEGYNLKMDGFQAAIVAAKFAHLDEWAELRQSVANRYTENLDDLPGVAAPFVPAHVRHAWRNFAITVPAQARSAIRADLQKQAITTSILYTPPIYLQRAYAGLGLGQGSFPAAESIAKQLLCLPIYPGLTAEQVDKVTSALAQSVAQAEQS